MTARVLIVDDDPALLEALPETLRLRAPDVAVDTCGSAAAALDRITDVDVDYDAIVTDVKMPGMDGLALLDRIRVLRPDTPTLFITGHGEHDLAVKSLRGGAYDYVQKPIDREYFVASLGRAIQVRQLRRQVAAQHQALERHARELEEAVAIRTRQLEEAAAEKARLYERQRGIAETLQRSLLPDRLPGIPGIAMGAQYLPGSCESVGGDWYDAFLLSSGQIALVIGDVAGRGVWAAAVMGQLRNAVRAYAHEGTPPGGIAERLNRLIEPGAMATLLYLVFDPETSTLRYSNQGHLPPLIVSPEGDVAMLGGGGPPLGTSQAFSRQPHSAVLPPGSTLVLYTDGLVEERGEPIDEGLRRLEQAVRRTAHLSVDEQVGRLPVEVRGGRPATDDIAVLALRASPLDAERLELQLPAMPESLPQLRWILRRWLNAAGVDPTEAYEILTACHEACANAVEHAYGPADHCFALETSAAAGGIAVTIRDDGRWRLPQGTRSGWGLMLMRAFMETVDIAPGPTGTIVTMRRRLTRGVCV